MSLEEAQRLTSLLEGTDSSGALPLEFDWAPGEEDDEEAEGGAGGGGHTAQNGAGGGAPWSNSASLHISSPEEVIRDVKKFVRERKPWLMEVDDTLLEKRRAEERSAEASCFIILPDNRVRCMDDQLDWRIKAQLLGQTNLEAPPEVVAAGAAQAAEKAVEKKVQRRTKKVRNPWYMGPKDWYDEKVLKQMEASSSEVNDDLRSMTSPYENLSKHTDQDEQSGGVGAPAAEAAGGLNAGGDPQQERPRRLTASEKETLQICDKYRKYLQQEGGRLPHFLA